MPESFYPLRHHCGNKLRAPHNRRIARDSSFGIVRPYVSCIEGGYPQLSLLTATQCGKKLSPSGEDFSRFSSMQHYAKQPIVFIGVLKAI